MSPTAATSSSAWQLAGDDVGETMTASAVEPRRRRSATSGRREPQAFDRELRVPFELDALASDWQRALDAAGGALTALACGPVGVRLGRGPRELVGERAQTETLLTDVADLIGVPAPWLSPVRVEPRMLGLPDAVEGCLFDLDGVLTD